MKTHLVSVGPDGPLIPIEVALPASQVQALRKHSAPIPQPVVALALIDTGADTTVLDPDILAPLIAAGLRHTRFLFQNAPALPGSTPVAPAGSTHLEPLTR